MAPRQRRDGREKQRCAVTEPCAGVVVIAAVAVAGQHNVPNLLLLLLLLVVLLLLDVVEGALLHLDAARIFGDWERGGAQLQGSTATAAGVS